MSDPVKDTLRFGEAIDIIRRFVPQFEVRDKKDSWLQRLIGWFSRPFNPGYMTDFWTTFGFKSYKPAAIDEFSWLDVLHEGKHAYRAKRLTRPMFYFLYMFPISLVPIILSLGFWHWWLMLLAPLVLVPKLPDPFRNLMELEGYKVNLAIEYWMFGEEMLSEENLAVYESFFEGKAYYYMMPFKSIVRKELARAASDVRTGKVLKDDYYVAIHAFMEEEGLLHVV